MLLRIGNMRGVDLSIFEFDYDMQWQAILLTADGNVLGRFGGRDAETVGAYHTLSGLKHSLAAGLERYKTAKDQKPTLKKPIRPEDYPAAEKRPDNACIHCHHVNEFRRDLLQREGRWSLDDVWVYPPAENLGLTLDIEQGDRVLRVVPKSPTAKLGIVAKDLLRRVNDMPIASIADVHYALHKTPKDADVTLVWQSGKETKKGVLTLRKNWRQSDVSWRWSLKSMSPNPGIIGDDLDPDGRKTLGLKDRQLAYRHMNFLTPSGRHAGLQANDVIVGVDDKELVMNARQFEAHLRLYYRVGQEVTLNVLRGKERIKLKLKLAE